MSTSLQLQLHRAFLWGVAAGAVLTVVGLVLGWQVAACTLYTRPEPYTPPPLVLQGTKPDDPEDAGKP